MGSTNDGIKTIINILRCWPKFSRIGIKVALFSVRYIVLKRSEVKWRCVHEQCELWHTRTVDFPANLNRIQSWNRRYSIIENFWFLCKNAVNCDHYQPKATNQPSFLSPPPPPLLSSPDRLSLIRSAQRVRFNVWRATFHTFSLALQCVISSPDALKVTRLMNTLTVFILILECVSQNSDGSRSRIFSSPCEYCLKSREMREIGLRTSSNLHFKPSARYLSLISSWTTTTTKEWILVGTFCPKKTQKYYPDFLFQILAFSTMRSHHSLFIRVRYLAV